MDRDSIDPPSVPPATTQIGPRGTCAIAPVRGDVTTMRAAAVVRARQRSPARATERARSAPGADAFPAHLLRVGPA